MRENSKTKKPSAVDLREKYNKVAMSDRLGDKGLVAEYKLEFLNCTDIEVKRGLLEAIAGLDKINSVYFFIEALADDDAEIRQEAAIQIMPMVVHPGVVDALIFTLNDKNDHQCSHIIPAQELIEPPEHA